MEVHQLKRLIKKNIVDFSELLIENYHKLGLDETDTIILIKLYKLIDRNIPMINPKILSETLSISVQTTSKRLTNLIEKKFISVELVKGENGKEKEEFNMDRIIELIIMFDSEERSNEELPNTSEKEIVELFESEFRKPLSPLDIQIITKWLNEENYTPDDIKEALFKAVKARKLTIKYVDTILLQTEESNKVEYKKTNIARDLHKLWEK